MWDSLNWKVVSVGEKLGEANLSNDSMAFLMIFDQRMGLMFLLDKFCSERSFNHCSTLLHSMLTCQTESKLLD